ncbi:vanadium-dependent haloperoxidase [Roseomonas sp. CCTCC AB2023176]|uniref:vanadium-dependent haloperoxidase n=1 Tax=Roseomonas sp. CCTCC AB2023176 TaxID=3342640 RepID=UPI0035E2B658
MEDRLPSPRPAAPHRPGRRWYSALLALLLALAPAGAFAQAQMFPGDGGTVGRGNELPGSPVTAWTLAADRLGSGGPNFRTRAIMHLAMHDALNAAEPRFARWARPVQGEPAPGGASPRIAMAAAAYQVLIARHPEKAAVEADSIYRAAIASEPPGPGVQAGIRLGNAIARARLAAYPNPTTTPEPFPGAFGVGQWRPTPPDNLSAFMPRERPFLQDAASIVPNPPNPVGSPRYLGDLEEVRIIGGSESRIRTDDMADAASFWAYHSVQRGYADLIIRLLAEYPMDLHGEARAMAVFSVAMADSVMVAWDAKRRFSSWRPVTAINLGSPGVPRDASWTPFLATPPHPEHPSGHASDCSAGATAIVGVFGRDLGPIEYVGVGAPGNRWRRFGRVSQTATECASSRLWAGAHFPTANNEGLRLGAEVARRALATMQPLPGRGGPAVTTGPAPGVRRVVDTPAGR